MNNADYYLHLIGLEMLIILGVVIPLLDCKAHKRALSAAFALVLGFMLAHFVSHVLPNRLADFIYSSHHDYRSLKTQVREPT